MAKCLLIFIVSALCVLGLAHSVVGEMFDVEGKVYCDTCRVLFPTKISRDLKDAEVELKCRNRENNTVMFTMRTTTDRQGHYKLTVPGDHETEICEVTATVSPDPECKETNLDISVGKVPIDNNSGIRSLSRYVNPIGFVQSGSDHRCTEVLNEMGFKPLNEMND